jgi:hypothetical protein
MSDYEKKKVEESAGIAGRSEKLRVGAGRGVQREEKELVKI